MRIVTLDGKRFAIAERVSPGILLHSQVSGRWSQVTPAFAQLPVKMRKIVGVDPGWPQLGYDYSNIEFRIAATLTQDEMFLSAIANNWDQHSMTACELFGMEYPPDRTKKFHTAENCAEWREQHRWQGEDDQRRKFGKIFLFRILYRGQPKSAYKIPGANKLGRTRDELEKAGERWLGVHPKVVEFWQKCDEDAIERFTSRTLSGRKRILMATDEMARAREGTNHRMQALVTSVVNDTVVLTMQLEPQSIALAGQMHDSLLFAVREERYDDLKPRMIEVAERDCVYGGIPFKFPISYYEKRGK